ncbi:MULTISPECIES: hypothetical protein [unclassified Streptomyces]|uniref:hypothetical protein n=1 Tax=unclassified Streptomyces TaxID=2593676 RepID=UPI00080507B9|nr:MULTISPECIES: hypothetical protein [unclassified Streptomyces]MYR73040.1 hypothetical protein [Streptomyces sp. SID4925]MYR76563.1 hypothetical protein [Streptomyces sp. SID4925]SBU96004.1 hypothetical protein YUMDRAFT_01653 [Streptomyces sp. OspMP-M45]SBV00092.1 hypothetical protein YUMDRAFT_06333 [Streptomyces sp. OspMP-M45]
MSAYVTITCNAFVPNLGQCMTEDSPLGAPQYATKARRLLHHEGWRRTPDGRDLCPEHATRAPEETQ